MKENVMFLIMITVIGVAILLCLAINGKTETKTLRLGPVSACTENIKMVFHHW